VDKITESMLDEFSKENELSDLKQDDRFEHFVTYAVVQRLYGETFDTGDVVLGSEEAGLDAVAIIVNGTLVPDVDAFHSVADVATTLDVVFIFIQADRSSSFNTGKMGTFAFTINDFFKDAPKLPQSARVKELAKLQAAIYAQSAKFKHSNPSCFLYYVTTGQWTGDQMLEQRRVSTVDELKAESIFGTVEFECIGADGIQKLYRQAKNAVARDFTFSNQIAAPDIPGVKEAYLGYIPAADFLSIIGGDDGEIMRGIFESNLRDFQSYNNVNSAIATTLGSDHKARFVLMNNGVTIIARVLRRTAHKFHIEDFQVVNGCQTSNVLFETDEDLTDVTIPLRLIATDDEDVIQSIVTATNQQTQLTREQLFAATEFPKKLEQFFQSFEGPRKLYYERRSRQYDRITIERAKVITQANTIRAFAGMFQEEPHRTTRNFNALLDNVGKTIFRENDRYEPYYVAAFALYKLERLFKAQKIDKQLKAARFQILLTARRIANGDALPNMNSKAMEAYCKKITDVLWDASAGDTLIERAAAIVMDVTKGNLDRDHIRTVAITDAIKNYKV